MGPYLLNGYRSERIHFRLFQEKDQKAWLPFFEDPASTAFWEGEPKDPEEACERQFTRIFHRYEQGLGGMNALTDIRTGALIGMAGLLVQEVDGKSELEIGYSLLPVYRGKGFATEAGLACRDTAFQRGWADSLISIIHIDNEPSMSVARRLGMQKTVQTRYKENPVWIFRIHAPA